MYPDSLSSVVDTVVLRYFLLVDQVNLLVALLGAPLGVPRIIFDPDEGDVPNNALSEITKSVNYQRRLASDPARDTSEKDDASKKATQLARVANLYQADDLVILDMASAELKIVSELVSPSGCKAFGLKFPLHPGEAACIAIGTTRGLVVATDDTDAIRALQAVAPGHPYDRIRKILIRGAETNIISKVEANQIHTEMQRLGFRDKIYPFPNTNDQTQVQP